MKINNGSTGIVIITDMPGNQTGQGLIIQPGATLILYDIDAQKSAQLAALITATTLTVIGTDQPSDGKPTAPVQNLLDLEAAGAPTDGVTGAGTAGPGMRYTDTTNKNVYINAGTLLSPVWKLITRAD